MKIELFECDYCKTRMDAEKYKGYPYEKGWTFLYNFEFKTTPSLTSCENRDKHFCCLEHLKLFILSKLDKEVKQ
jgi:hypothetical protein